MHNPAVSVVIPTYNRAHCLRDAIDSVLAQSFQDHELIVVDDGSTDETSEVVKAYGDRMKLIRQENSGVSSARNTGIRAGKGKWIAFLDSDDTWEPDKLKVQINDLRANPGAVAHMVDATIVISDDEYRSLFELRGLYDEFKQKPFRERPLSDVLNAQFFTPTWMLHRSALESAGYFDPAIKIYEDFDLLTRVAMEGPFFVNCYIGTNVRRKDSYLDLSILHEKDRLQSLRNLLNTYSHLKKDLRLTTEERRLVRRSIGGVQCEIAAQHRCQRNYFSALGALFRSIAEEPGLRSLARAILNTVGDRDFIYRLAPWHKKPGFRRSELDRQAGRIDR